MGRLNILSDRCANTHSPKDIVEHFEEELLELLLAIKRWKRNKGPLKDVIEEACDVQAEVNTFFILLIKSGITSPTIIDIIREEKLDKFESMLNKEQACYTLPVPEKRNFINRYMDPIEEYLKGQS